MIYLEFLTQTAPCLPLAQVRSSLMDRLMDFQEPHSFCWLNLPQFSLKYPVNTPQNSGLQYSKPCFGWVFHLSGKEWEGMGRNGKKKTLWKSAPFVDFSSKKASMASAGISKQVTFKDTGGYSIQYPI
jgi:hypothetical protein